MGLQSGGILSFYEPICSEDWTRPKLPSKAICRHGIISISSIENSFPQPIAIKKISIREFIRFPFPFG